MSSINPQTPINIPIAMALGGIVALAALVWRASAVLNQMDMRSAKMEQAIQKLVNDQWTVNDQEKWIYRLEKANRDGGKLIVPEILPRP